ncbi:SRPBCC family protein [Nocardioides sp. SLBN-35]|uniref:SRPBCC family protein n=1 Tax=Nocardioides sp. SLBN-35 TaxID=2768445 RepID=UPI0011515DE7|nr:SRPBCC family protein [Nocardioides sp. SLBN-35]TQK68345.1 polyketide cyclase/dehydrase/lipid transport protein [Nocardioides sp. SLBN-35]
MPVVQSRIRVPVPPEVAFAVSQTTGPVRRRWDVFIREQHFLDGATEAATGVRTFTRQRLGPSMVSRYVSYAPPRNVGMVMERGPWFFERLGAGWRFEADGEGTVATWKYSFTCRPRLLAPLAERIGRVLLGREIRARIAGFARGCEDPVVLAAIRSAEEG